MTMNYAGRSKDGPVEPVASAVDLTGPALDSVVAEVTQWYVQTRLELVKQLSNPYPYGSVQLTPQEQYSNYTQLQPQDKQNMRMALYKLYVGDPDAINKVEQEMLRYDARMQAIGSKLGMSGGLGSVQPTV